ncbi:RNA polymerase sigma factor [Flagellimonas pacifica]|uniref:RNA polymerase sigma factor n=1 Tax=Flagellimonas pacifica TaxID=1247520 RepID=A0A285MTK9_9FLAO|nr:RNA polymerase sigma-70 factor [Allomuricauda parva]SNZ00468.1 RNA polymerase sigma-70 factor, ECF subfamily [Allomuricauda parva]
MENLDKNLEPLLLSLKKGDKIAFKAIFKMYRVKLFHFVFSLSKSDYVTEEILQEVFITVWTKRENIDVSKSFNSFIYTIARNATYNHLRSIANRESLKQELWKNLNKAHDQTQNAILLAEYQDIVNDILENIPTQKRSIFVLSKQQGKSNQEIADLLGISPKTVKNHLWKTLQIIKEQLQPHLVDTIGIIALLIASF